MSKLDNTHTDKTTPSFRVSRRNFLKAAGAGTAVAGATAFGSIPFSQSRAAAQGEWDEEADIVVVGSGAGALSAAAIAHSLGNSVIVLEKANIVGGTTAKSAGTYWVPNNSLMVAAGIEDPKEDALKYMVRLSFPEHYDPDHPTLGINEHKYSLIEGFYDNGPAAIDKLAEIGALESVLVNETTGEPFPDYFAELEQNKAPRGRGLGPAAVDGAVGGAGLISQLVAYTEANEIPIQLEKRVVSVVTNEAGEVIGVETEAPDSLATAGATPEANVSATRTAVRAKKAVVFGTGGFTHNSDLVTNFLRGPIIGGCAVPTNEGDFIGIAGAVGADFGNMRNAYFAEVVVEQAIAFASVPTDIFMTPGDSMITVNSKGHRVYNEKSGYNERTQIHWAWDPTTATYPNYATIMIYDQHSASTRAGAYPIPAEGVEAPYVISGDTLEELSANIDARLEANAAYLMNARLDEHFVENLMSTVERFNEFADSGVDADFHRGETAAEVALERYFGLDTEASDAPNPMMRAISDVGPYYAILIGPGTLDTNGGPKVNAKSQVLDTEGTPIPGLYGVGNAVESASGQAYWAGGGTLGPILTTGYMAALTANEEPVKNE